MKTPAVPRPVGPRASLCVRLEDCLSGGGSHEMWDAKPQHWGCKIHVEVYLLSTYKRTLVRATDCLPSWGQHLTGTLSYKKGPGP